MPLITDTNRVKEMYERSRRAKCVDGRLSILGDYSSDGLPCVVLFLQADDDPANDVAITIDRQGLSDLSTAINEANRLIGLETLRMTKGPAR